MTSKQIKQNNDKEKEEKRKKEEESIDETIEESFPASDPPAWNPGIIDKK